MRPGGCVWREQVAKALGAEPDRVFFTSGGTEADNWAVGSSMERMGKRGKHVITTAVEHHAVLNPVKRLEERGFAVTYLEPTPRAGLVWRISSRRFARIRCLCP